MVSFLKIKLLGWPKPTGALWACGPMGFSCVGLGGARLLGQIDRSKAEYLW